MSSVECIGTYKANRKSRRDSAAKRWSLRGAVQREWRGASLLMATWCQRMALRRGLKVAPDRMLASMGLTRDAAANEAAKPFWVA
ncbi:MAG: hypothetical protein JXQ84_00425 [Rhodospirillaceae bacterium]|nr:hypothetical protein [Rhodospirillaceae bacterium]